MSVTICMRHVRGAGMCSRGTRAFFERHGLDYGEFLQNGLPVEAFDGIDDAMLQQVVEVAMREAKENE